MHRLVEVPLPRVWANAGVATVQPVGTLAAADQLNQTTDMHRQGEDIAGVDASVAHSVNNRATCWQSRAGIISGQF